MRAEIVQEIKMQKMRKIRLLHRALQRCLKSNTHVSLKTLNVFVIIYKAEQPVRIATAPARVRCRCIRGI